MTETLEAQWVSRAREGDRQAMGNLLERHQDRLLRLIRFRLDRRLQGRVDPADVLQEAFIDVTRRQAELPQAADSPLFHWLRFLVLQKLAEVHRRHLGVRARDATREVSIYDASAANVSSAVLAGQLLGKLTSPSQAAMQAELKYRLEQTLDAMSSLDREIIVLRHFEQLSNAEAAHVLGISDTAASTRYVRAIRRLRQTLEGEP